MTTLEEIAAELLRINRVLDRLGVNERPNQALDTASSPTFAGLTTTGQINDGAGLGLDGETASLLRGNSLDGVANNAINQLGKTAKPMGIFFITNELFGRSAIYEVQGGANAVAEIADPSGGFSPTKGNAGTINVYYDAGNARYEIENKCGSTTALTIFYFTAP